MHSVIRSISKLPLADRMHRMQMADADMCLVCHRKEDHERRAERCPYLDNLIQVLKGLSRPIQTATRGHVEPARICLDHPELSLRREQGIFIPRDPPKTQNLSTLVRF